MLLGEVGEEKSGGFGVVFSEELSFLWLGLWVLRYEKFCSCSRCFFSNGGGDGVERGCLGGGEKEGFGEASWCRKSGGVGETEERRTASG